MTCTGDNRSRLPQHQAGSLCLCQDTPHRLILRLQSDGKIIRTQNEICISVIHINSQHKLKTDHRDIQIFANYLYQISNIFSDVYNMTCIF